MSIMDNIFPENKTQSDYSKSELLLGNEKNIINEYGAIPDNISKNDVIELSKNAGNLECDIELMKLWSEQSLNIQNNALTALDLRINHASQSMKNQQSFNKKMAKHGKNLASHNLTNEVIKSNYDGFQSALNAANETIAL